MEFKRGQPLEVVCPPLFEWLNEDRHQRSAFLALVHEHPLATPLDDNIRVKAGSDLWLLVPSIFNPTLNVLNYYPQSLVTEIDWECPAAQAYFVPDYISDGSANMAFVEFPHPVDCPLAPGEYVVYGFFVLRAQLTYTK